MSSALLAALFATLGMGLAVTSTACFVLRRRVRALTSAVSPRPDRGRPPSVSVSLPGIGAAKPPTKARSELARRLDELAGRHRALEARLARVEASSAGGSIAIASHPGGPGLGRRADRGHSSATSGGPTLISIPDLATPSTPASGAEAALGRRFGAVWSMADSGLAVEAIARETGHPVGQVELILGLRRQILGAEARPDG